MKSTSRIERRWLGDMPRPEWGSVLATQSPAMRPIREWVRLSMGRGCTSGEASLYDRGRRPDVRLLECAAIDTTRRAVIGGLIGAAASAAGALTAVPEAAGSTVRGAAVSAAIIPSTGRPSGSATGQPGGTRGRRSGGSRRPNLVFFLGEGLRHDEFSIAGNSLLKTPNLDRIAREGAWFRNAFCTNALCLPSRASFLTGAYSHTTGAATNDENQVPARFPMVSDLLREHGYETAFIGKSHVGGALMDRKWDYYFGFKGQADYLHPEIVEGRNGAYGEPKVYDEYVDDLLTRKAVEWVKSRSDKPFCLFLWFYAPHAPFYRPRRMLDLFNGARIPVPENFDDDLKGYPGKARAVAEAENKIGTTQVFTDDPRSLEEIVKDHYVGVESNDEDVGKVLDAISAHHKLDETVVLLSSDHGFFLGEHTFYDKRLMYEPAIRIPMMIRFPGMIGAGTVREEMVLNIDVPVTLLDIAGVPIPATMQGRSFLPLAMGRTVGD